MSSEDIARAALAWQADPKKLTLTCATDSSHRRLVPLEKGGSVILICPSCDYEQVGERYALSDKPAFMPCQGTSWRGAAANATNWGWRV